MKKKLISVVMAGALLCMALAGCSGAGGAKGGSETFKLGGIGPLTGVAAIYGTNVMNAVQIAVDEVNAAGGINGYQVEFKSEDDTHDPEKAINAYNNLKDWGMQALIGTVTTTPCLAVAPKTGEDRMFQITPSASAVDVIDGNDNVFQVCFTDPNQGTASAQYIADNNLGTKIAIIYNSADVYSSGIEATFVKEAANKGLDVVAIEAFTDDSATDYSTQLQKAKSAGADLVFLPIYYTPASVILKQANDMGYAPTFFGVDGMDGILTVENFDVSLAEGVILLTPFAADAQDAATQKFVAEYQKRFGGEIPNQFAADGYDAVYAIKAALEAAHAKPSMSTSELCDAICEQMTKIEVDGITGKMTWSADGAVSKTPKAVVIKNGAYVAM